MSLMMAVAPTPSRAEPWPYDVVINDYGLVCGDPTKGVKHAGIAGEKPDDMSQVAPTDFSYGALNPRLGAITSYGDMPLGLGQRMQRDIRDPRYRYTINANLSCGLWQKGPEMTLYSPVGKANAPVNRQWEYGGALYWSNGQYVYKQDAAGVITLSKDLGAGKSVSDVVVFWSNAATVTQSYVYLAMGDADNAWRFDGATWTQHTGTLKARAWVVIGRNLWRAHDKNKISLVNIDADPWVEANWAAPNSYYVGERTYGIMRLIALPGGEMVVLKEDQPYIFDIDEGDRPLYPYLGLTPDAGQGGEAWGTYINDNFVTYGKGTWKISPDLGIEQVGPEKLTENDTPVKGRITAYGGHDVFYMYAGLYNDDTSTSYLVQFGAWVQEAREDPQRVDAWHGSLSEAFVGVRITSMKKTAIGAPAGHSRMSIGFSDGTVRSFVLSCQANPAGCSAYRWSLADGEVYLPTWTGKFESDVKALRGITASALEFTSVKWVEVDYKLSPSTATWTSMPDIYDSGTRESVNFPRGLSATLVDIRVRLRSSATTITPLVQGIGFLHQLHTPLRQIRTVPVLCADGLTDREGKALRWGSSRIREILRQAHDTAPGVTMVFPDTGEGYYKIIGWQEVLAFDRVAEGWRSAIQLTCGEVVDDVDPGSYSALESLTYGMMESYLYSELEAFL